MSVRTGTRQWATALQRQGHVWYHFSTLNLIVQILIDALWGLTIYDEHGQSYCGMVPRVLMNSVQIGSSTHARASHDYVPGQEIGQWAVGGPSVFLWGLGLLPYKDTWMTTSATPLNRRAPVTKTIDTVSERAPLLHTIAAIVAGGPVAFGDCVGGPLAANRQDSVPPSTVESDRPFGCPFLTGLFPGAGHVQRCHAASACAAGRHSAQDGRTRSVG